MKNARLKQLTTMAADAAAALPVSLMIDGNHNFAVITPDDTARRVKPYEIVEIFADARKRLDELSTELQNEPRKQATTRNGGSEPGDNQGDD